MVRRDTSAVRLLRQGAAVYQPHEEAARRRIPLANFYASGVLALREKLGPILWQLPPNLGFNPARLAQFFAKLPRTSSPRLALRETTRTASLTAP